MNAAAEAFKRSQRRNKLGSIIDKKTPEGRVIFVGGVEQYLHVTKGYRKKFHYGNLVK